MRYQGIRNLLFKLSPETSHELSLDMIGALDRLKLSSFMAAKVSDNPVNVMGLEFKNPVGLAAGLDKNADHLDGLAALGFGFVEVGTVTPRPQPGNPQPRLFRLPDAQAIINRMGFNNHGIDHLIERVKASKYKGILGINIGKNFDTPVEEATNDYLICLRKAYPYANYITINISSPNTPGLRNLQFGESLDELLSALKKEQGVLQEQHNKYVPLAIKIAPDMTDEEIELVAGKLLSNGMDAVIATNTTLDKTEVAHLEHGEEAGGLSGAPVTEQSTHVVAELSKQLKGEIPIIAVGGIMDGASAVEKIKAGASLVQLYTGFIYRGPELIQEVADAIASVKEAASVK